MPVSWSFDVERRIIRLHTYSDQILKAILPVELHDDLPSSFTIVGHIGELHHRGQALSGHTDIEGFQHTSISGKNIYHTNA